MNDIKLDRNLVSLVEGVEIADFIDNFQCLFKKVLHFNTGAPALCNVFGFTHEVWQFRISIKFRDQFVLERILHVIDQKVHDCLGDHIDKVLSNHIEITFNERLDDFRLDPFSISRWHIGLTHGNWNLRQLNNAWWSTPGAVRSLKPARCTSQSLILVRLLATKHKIHNTTIVMTAHTTGSGLSVVKCINIFLFFTDWCCCNSNIIGGRVLIQGRGR
mmetsp:Transcript_6945/g.12478  ORF Transcript_6945/g.12478 Transcript_6945/m.12478 type:complete len:217 (+) Transcript_6945:77-727(+)